MSLRKLGTFLTMALAVLAVPVPDWSDGNTTPFEISDVRSGEPGKTHEGARAISFTIVDPDTECSAKCSVSWKPHAAPPVHMKSCSDGLFSFRVEGYKSLTAFELEIAHACVDGSPQGCKTELASAGFETDDDNWKVSPSKYGYKTANYTGTFAVPVYPEW